MNISNVREDAFILRKLYEIARNSHIPLDEFAELPLLIIPPIYTDGFGINEHVLGEVNDWNKFFEDTMGEGGWNKDSSVFDNTMKEFVFVHDMSAGTPNENLGIKIVLYGHVINNGDNVKLNTYMHVPIRKAKTFIIEEFNQKMEFMPPSVFTKDNYGWRGACLGHSCYTTDSRTHMEYQAMIDIADMAKKAEGTTRMEFEMNNVVSIIIGFLTFAYLGDKYPIHVRSNTEISNSEKKRRKKKPWVLRNAPRLIYLNSIQEVENKEHQGGTHASPTPHQRRGCWKTLRHEKFKNHPMYQVENGVYTRPCIVGNTDEVINGNRYTIITKGVKS